MQAKNRAIIIIEPEIMKTIKRIANNKKTTQTQIINEYLKKGIKEEPPENKSKIKFIVKPDSNKNIDDLIGTIKAPKDFNTVEAVKEVRSRKG